MAEPNSIVLALSVEHITKLTGLTKRQLAYWDAKGFFRPEYAADDRRSPNARIYSFRDAVGLRTISVLLNVHGVPVRHLADVAQKLAAYTDRPWSELKLRVWNRRVQFDEPETGATRDVVMGQYVLLPIIDVIHALEKQVEELKTRSQDQIGQFERRPNVSRNNLVLAGTRVPVTTILEYLDDGYSSDSILQNFPTLTADDIEAVKHRGKTALAA